MNKGVASNLTTNRRIVLIGSMGVYEKILSIAERLNVLGINTIVPEAEGGAVQQLSLFDFESFKRRVSFAYLRKIRDPRTYCVFAINQYLHGMPDYIGPNTFAEIAVAFAQSKKIYLYQSIPEAYCEELSAWRGIQLRGSLDKLITDFRTDCMVENAQLRLLD